MGRKIAWVSMDLALAAIFRDDRKRLNEFNKADYLAPFITCDGLPDDARIVDVGHNPVTGHGQIGFVLESSEWPEVPTGCHLTALNPTLTSYTSYATYLEVQAGKQLNSLPEAIETTSIRRGREFI